MIDKTYVMTMARYNAWQNKQLIDILQDLDAKTVEQDRQAFFGSILGTLNHLLWGDTIWMSRWCDDVAKPDIAIPKSARFTNGIGPWGRQRFAMDGRIRIWAQTLSNLELLGDLSWYSGATGRQVTQPKGLCITHMFNHQTHHRGQVHAMLTQAGAPAPVSDLAFLPEDA